MTDNSINFYKRANDIFDNKISGEKDSVLENRENKEAYALLRFIDFIGVKLQAVDEAKIINNSDWKNYILNSQNVFAYEFELQKDWNKKDLGTFLGIDKTNNEYIILYRKNNNYYGFNPNTNKTIKITKENTENFEGTALFAIPKITDKILDLKKIIKNIILFLKKDIYKFIKANTIAALVTFLAPMFVLKLINTNLIVKSISDLMQCIILILCIIGVMITANLILNQSKINLQIKFRHRVFTVLFSRLLSITSSDEKKISDAVISMFMPFIGSLETISNAALSIISYFTQSVAMIFVIFFLAKEYVLYFVIILVLFLVVTFLFELKAYKQINNVKMKEKSFSILRREIIENIESIKNNAYEDKAYYRFAVLYDDFINEKLKLININNNISLFCIMLGSACFFFILFINHYILLDNVLSITKFFSIFTIVISYLSSIVSSANGIVVSIPYLSIVNDIMKASIEENDSSGIHRKITGNINISHVKFSYDKGSNVILKDIDMSIGAGEYIGVVGASGSGKSTLIRLLLGFEKADFGNIYYDDIDISQYNLKSLRNQLGVVLQTSEVITGNILMNISMEDEPDMERIREAAKMASILDDIEAMPMKFNTILSSDSELISGGQKQRIAIARTLYHNPKILIFDEATSALDNVSQNIIKKNLDSLGITRIVVAHRLSTIVSCDRIYVLDKGIVAETGNYDELMKKNGLFASMARRNLI